MPDMLISTIATLLFITVVFTADEYGRKVLKLFFVASILLIWLFIAAKFTELKTEKVEYIDIQDIKMPEGHIIQIFNTTEYGKYLSSRKNLLDITSEYYYYPSDIFMVKKTTYKSRFSGGIYWVVTDLEKYEVCKKS